MLKILLILANLITSCSSQVNTVLSCLSPYHTLCLISLLISLSPLCPLFKLPTSFFLSLLLTLPLSVWCRDEVRSSHISAYPLSQIPHTWIVLFSLKTRYVSVQFRLASTSGSFCLYHVSGAKIRSMCYRIQHRDFSKSIFRSDSSMFKTCHCMPTAQGRRLPLLQVQTSSYTLEHPQFFRFLHLPSSTRT